MSELTREQERDLRNLAERAGALAADLRTAVAQVGGRGPVAHALNVAATHAQDAMGAIFVAGAGGSPGVK